MSIQIYKDLVENLFNDHPISSTMSKTLANWSRFRTTKRLFNKLISVDALKHCYQKSAFVGEGYTVLEHSRNVVAIAKEHRAQLEPTISLPWKEFLLFLALHDIGKGLARESLKNRPSKENAFTQKSAELTCTRLIIQKIAAQCGLSEKTLKIYNNLLKNDLIGDYLKGKTNVKKRLHVIETLHTCLKSSAKCGLSDQQMLDTFVAFHMCDAASYSTLKRNIFKTNTDKLAYSSSYEQKIAVLQYKINQIKEGESIFQALLEDIKNKVSPNVIDKKFWENLPQLNAYLMKEQTHLLNAQVASPNQRDRFAYTKKGFRDILLNVFQVADRSVYNKDNLNDRVENYKKNVAAFRFNTTPSFPIRRYDRNFWNFRQELMIFRNTFQAKFSKEKIRKVDPSFEPEHLEDLENTFFHGTNSGLLLNLPLTDYCMVPSGQLKQLGVVALSGELLGGATIAGVNHTKLSGVGIRDIKTALYYSKSFTLDSKKIREKLDEYVEDLNQYIKENENFPLIRYQQNVSRLNGNALSNLAYTILKVREIQALTNCYNPDELQQKLVIISQIANKLQSAFNDYKGTQDYRKHMPKAKDRRFGWHDKCYYYDFKIFEDSLHSIKQAISKELCIPDASDMSYINDAFPMVVAVKSTYTSPPFINSTEVFSHMSLQFGHDIKTLYVHKENNERLTLWLQKHQLDNKIQVRDIEILKNYKNRNDSDSYRQDIKPAECYMDDIVSRKKLSKLLEDGKDFVRPLPLNKPNAEPNFHSHSVTRIKKIYNFIKYTLNLAFVPKQKFSDLLANSEAKKNPEYKEQSKAEIAYLLGRRSDESWKTYMSSYFSGSAWTHWKAYHLGRQDMKNDTSEICRIELKKCKNKPSN